MWLFSRDALLRASNENSQHLCRSKQITFPVIHLFQRYDTSLNLNSLVLSSKANLVLNGIPK